MVLKKTALAALLTYAFASESVTPGEGGGSNLINALNGHRPWVKSNGALNAACEQLVKKCAQDGTVQRVGNSKDKYGTIVNAGYEYDFAAVFLAKTPRSDKDCVDSLLLKDGAPSKDAFLREDAVDAGSARNGDYICVTIGKSGGYGGGQPSPAPKPAPRPAPTPNPQPKRPPTQPSQPSQPSKPPQPPPTTPPPSTQPPGTSYGEAFNRESVPIINSYRTSSQYGYDRQRVLGNANSIGSLSSGPTSQALCHKILSLMQRHNVFDHTVAGSTLGSRCTELNAGACAENIAKGSFPGGVNKSWWESPGHQRNILNTRVKYVYTCENDGWWAQVFTSNA